MISRRVVQTLLGLVWFLDGLLQLKPQMFTPAFVKQVILPVADGQPHWISALVNVGANIAIGHIVLWNAIFAAIQLLLGLALTFNIKTRAAIVTSIVWSTIVWIFGEGFGQILTGQSLLLTGAPGAALIYGLVGGAIWPDGERGPSVWSPSGIRFAQLSLAGLFIFGSILHFQRSALSPIELSQAIANPWLANVIGHQGRVVSLILTGIELAVAVMLIGKLGTRIAVWVSITLSLLFWWAGQSFGQIFEPLATDFNSGLLMVILALCSYPLLWRDTTRGHTADRELPRKGGFSPSGSGW